MGNFTNSPCNLPNEGFPRGRFVIFQKSGVFYVNVTFWCLNAILKCFQCFGFETIKFCKFRSNLCVRFKRARNSTITISFEIANLIEFKLVLMSTGLCFMNSARKLLSATKYSNGRIFCSEQWFFPERDEWGGIS